MSLAELMKALKEKSIVFGSKETIKNLKRGTVKRVFLASNCPKKIAKEVDYYAKLGKVELIKLDQPNDELALLCKKPYPVTVVSI